MSRFQRYQELYRLVSYQILPSFKAHPPCITILERWRLGQQWKSLILHGVSKELISQWSNEDRETLKEMVPQMAAVGEMKVEGYLVRLQFRPSIVLYKK